MTKSNSWRSIERITQKDTSSPDCLIRLPHATQQNSKINGQKELTNVNEHVQALEPDTHLQNEIESSSKSEDKSDHGRSRDNSAGDDLQNHMQPLSHYLMT